jgi:metal-responsive CopG/Arc/MetJ family transcriptional regulator
MLYIMKRTQLYLDEELWQALHARAATEKTTISELVRKAARDRYLMDPEKRRAAMMGIVGMWKDRTDLPDTETYVRSLRKGTRLERLGIK